MPRIKKRPLHWTIDTPLCIIISETRIIENCIVEMNAAIMVSGKMILRDCLLVGSCPEIKILGHLKIENCDVQLNLKMLKVMKDGEYLFDRLYFEDTETKIICSNSGRIDWCPQRQSVESYLEKNIVACVADYYHVDKEAIYKASRVGYSEDEIKVLREALNVSIYLLRNLSNMPMYRLTRFNVPSYLVGDIAERAEKYVFNGDKELWEKVSRISVQVARELYERTFRDELSYPYRD